MGQDKQETDPLQRLLNMHDETDARDHRDLTHKGTELKWEHINFLKQIYAERGVSDDTTHYIGKGVKLWLVISVLTVMVGALLVAAKQALLPALLP